MSPPCQSVPPHLPSMSFSHYFTYRLPYFLFAWKVSTPVNSRRFASDSKAPPITLWDLHALHQNTGMTLWHHTIITFNQFTNFDSLFRTSNTVTIIFFFKYWRVLYAKLTGFPIINNFAKVLCRLLTCSWCCTSDSLHWSFFFICSWADSNSFITLATLGPVPSIFEAEPYFQ